MKKKNYHVIMFTTIFLLLGNIGMAQDFDFNLNPSFYNEGQTIGENLITAKNVSGEKWITGYQGVGKLKNQPDQSVTGRRAIGSASS